MKVNQCNSAIALIILSNAALATTYQGEGLGAYNDWDGDNAYELSVTAYFAPLSTQGHPLRQAAFLERANSANATFFRFDSAPDVTDVGAINLSYYVPNSMFYIGGHYTRIDEAEDEFASDYRESNWGLTLGITPAEGLLISTSYRAAPVYAGSLLGRLIGGGVFSERDSYETNLSAKYVTQLRGGKAANFEGGLVQSGESDLIFLGGDYYIDHTFSIGAWIEDYDSAGLDTGYGFRAEKFFTSQVSVQSSYFDISDANMWRLAVRVRF